MPANAIPGSFDLITALELRDCGYQEVLANYPLAYFDTLRDLLFRCAQEAHEAGSKRRSQALQLLGELCAMRLDAVDLSDPYKPGLIRLVDDQRSVVPEDFDHAQLMQFADAAASIEHPLLRARLADLAWSVGRTKKLEHALLAINGYWAWVATPDAQRWRNGQEECISRALELALRIRDDATAWATLIDIEQALLTAFDYSSTHSGFSAAWYASMLLKFGLARPHAERIVKALQASAEVRYGKQQYEAQRYYLRWAECWCRAQADQTTAAQLLVASAASFEAEGDRHPASIVAVQLYDQAIQIWQDMPRKTRGLFDGDVRIRELRRKLAEAGRNAIAEELRPIALGREDLTELAALARERVRGKPGVSVLNAFTRLHHGPDADALHQAAINGINGSFLSRLFNDSTTFSADGRPIAKIDGSTNDLAAERSVIKQRMVQYFVLEARMVARGLILPALDVLYIEHNIRRGDMLALAAGSALVPRDRESLVARGLYAGFCGDFMQALHLLTPQLEHIVRYHLKRAGAETTTIKDSVVTENGLSTLIRMPEAEQIFGADLQFEISALFCEKDGPNFRNDLAHGLIEESQLMGDLAVYAWWMMYRLVFEQFWKAQRPSPSSDVASGPATAPIDIPSEE